MKTIIAGGREFDLKDYLYDAMNNSVGNVSEVVCGEARGADSLGKEWAISNGVPVTSFPADWNKHGRSAGPIRNKEMGDYADQLVAFWDGKSRGTKNMIDYMKKLGKRVHVFSYET